MNSAGRRPPKPIRISDLFADGTNGPNIIDVHGHLGYAGYHAIPWPEAGDIVYTLDRLGIDQVWISSLRAINGGEMRAGNDEVGAASRAFPGRIRGFAVAHPHYPSAITAELARCFDELGMIGVKIHPATYTHDYPVTGRNYRAVWEFAEARGCPVLVHSGPAAEVLMNGPKAIGEVAASYPTVKIIVAHCGGAYERFEALEPTVEVMLEHENLYTDISGTARFRGVVEYMVERLGPDRILFGTDGPFHCFTADLASVLFARVDPEEKRAVLGSNAKALLGVAALTEEAAELNRSKA